LQFLQVQGLQRQPEPEVQPHLQVDALTFWRSFISWSPFPLLPVSESPYALRTMVQSQAIRSLTIGKLAKTGGVGVETIRYYQRRGLLETPTRDVGIRRYGSDDVRRLRFIKQAQAAGFTLEEIKELLDLDASEDRSRARELARARVTALDEKIAELEQARDALRRLARECGSGKAGPCPILKSFEV
jgi:MerR family mercuric resistance operon transcriptional regulator